MSRKIGVIGSGHVGSTVAHYIVACGFVDDLVLIDKNKDKVVSDATDFREAMPNLPFHTNIIVNDYSALKDADVIISAIGNIKLQETSNGNRFAELPFTSKNVKEVAAKIKDSGFNGVLVAITNPVDVITQIYQDVTGLPKNQVIGTGTLLDSARMKRAVGAKLNLDSRSVTGYNLGEHGNSQFTAWSTVRVFDKPIKEVAKEKSLDLNALEQDAIHGGFTVFYGKNYTNYGVATAAVRLAMAVMNDAHAEMAASNYRKEYGIYLSYPVIIGRKGVVGHVKLDLTDEEKQKLQKSANYIETNYKKYKN